MVKQILELTYPAMHFQIHDAPSTPATNDLTRAPNLRLKYSDTLLVKMDNCTQGLQVLRCSK